MICKSLITNAVAVAIVTVTATATAIPLPEFAMNFNGKCFLTTAAANVSQQQRLGHDLRLEETINTYKDTKISIKMNLDYQ